MKALNKETAPKVQRLERIIQFGEGNFLRAFVDWIIYNMNQKTDFNSSVVVVQPIDKGMVDVKSLISHRFKLEDLPTAMAQYLAEKDKAVKAIMVNE